MKKYFLILAVLLSCGQQPRVDAPVSEKTAEQEIKGTLLNTEEQIDKPYVLLISIDGFR